MRGGRRGGGGKRRDEGEERGWRDEMRENEGDERDEEQTYLDRARTQCRGSGYIPCIGGGCLIGFRMSEGSRGNSETRFSWSSANYHLESEFRTSARDTRRFRFMVDLAHLGHNSQASQMSDAVKFTRETKHTHLQTQVPQ